jgi:hypothetical protein
MGLPLAIHQSVLALVGHGKAVALLKWHEAILADVPAENCHLHNILASFPGIFIKIHNIFVLFDKVLRFYISMQWYRGVVRPWKQKSYRD